MFTATIYEWKTYSYLRLSFQLLQPIFFFSQILTLEHTMMNGHDDKYMRHLNLEPKSVLREIGQIEKGKSDCR